MGHEYFVYILASRSRQLYTGITGDLIRRMVEHRQGLVPGFTSRYRVFRLVHFELFGNANEAIAREKEIKGWRREKKIWLIERHNPTWREMTEQLPHHFGAIHGSEEKKTDPSPHPPKAGGWVRDDSATN